MTAIVEYNLSTGHTETLCVVPDDEALKMAELLNDHSTDHVVFTREDGVDDGPE